MTVQRGGLKNGSYVHRRGGHLLEFDEGCLVMRLIGNSISPDVEVWMGELAGGGTRRGFPASFGG